MRLPIQQVLTFSSSQFYGTIIRNFPTFSYGLTPLLYWVDCDECDLEENGDEGDVYYLCAVIVTLLLLLFWRIIIKLKWLELLYVDSTQADTKYVYNAKYENIILIEKNRVSYTYINEVKL